MARYKDQLTKLRDELSAIRSDTPTCRLEIVDLEDDGVVRSYAGSEFANAVRLPREAVDVDEWLRSLDL